jgi:hypothetical protein
MAFGKKRTLRVEFIEARTQRLIGFDEMRLRDVPESFKDETWVEIDGDRWKVVRAEPAKMRQAKRDGLLKVQVDLVEKRTPEVVETPVVEEVKEAPVYRNPSRADQMPRLSGKRGDLQLMEIATHEWRDIEMTVASNRSTVRDVFAKIEELILLNSTQRDGRTFYTRQYDRYEMFAPMRGARLPLETVITDYFPDAKAVDGLTFMGSDQVADSTFVFRVGSGIGFYGQEFDDIVRYLALTRPDTLLPAALEADAAKIAALMKRKELIIVDWQRRLVVEATPAAVYDYFLQGFADHAVATAQSAKVVVEKPIIVEPPAVPPVAAAVEPPVVVSPEQPAVTGSFPAITVVAQETGVPLTPAADVSPPTIIAETPAEQPQSPHDQAESANLNSVTNPPASDGPVLVEESPVIQLHVQPQEIAEPQVETPAHNPMLEIVQEEAAHPADPVSNDLESKSVEPHTDSPEKGGH